MRMVHSPRVGKVPGMSDEPPFKTESDRCRAVRKLYADEGKKGTEKFAKGISLTYNRWNNFENGFPLSRAAAFLLHEKYPDISIDWIWWGVTRGMTHALLEELREAAKKGDDKNNPK